MAASIQNSGCDMPSPQSHAKPAAVDKFHNLMLSNSIILRVGHSAKEAIDLAKDVPPANATERAYPCLKPQRWWTGCSIWESAKVLSKLLSAEPERVRGKRVLELGAGCGMLGLVAGALGAHEITLTDEILFMAAYNLDINFVEQPELRERFKLQQLVWGNEEQMAALSPPYDIILGADLMYDRVDILADTLINLSRPGTTILLAAPECRAIDSFSGRRFYGQLRKGGVDVVDILTDEVQLKKAKLYMDTDRGHVNIVELAVNAALL